MGQMTTFNINPFHRMIAQADPLGKIPDRENPRKPRMTHIYNAGNQLTKAEPEGGSATDYTYDASGDRLTEAGPTSTTTLTWDYENRRVLSSNSLGIEYEDAYDADGKRFREKLTIGGVEQYVRKYVWDFENVLLETNGSNVTQTIYTLEPAHFGNLVSKRASGSTQYYHFDALGSTANVTDSSQTVVNDYLYTAFGVPVAGSANLTQPYTYVGQLGYYSVGSPTFTYVRARWYQPSTNQFFSMDPIVIGDTHSVPLSFRYSVGYSNSYCYSLNKPTGFVDPSGEITCPPGEVYAPKPGFEPTTDGCSAPSIIPDPNRPPKSASFKDPCDAHDLCYQDCLSTKSECDSQFLDDMLKACETTANDPTRPADFDLTICKNWAKRYQAGVQTPIGDRRFDENQSNACACQPFCNPGSGPVL